MHRRAAVGGNSTFLISRNHRVLKILEVLGGKAKRGLLNILEMLRGKAKEMLRGKAKRGLSLRLHPRARLGGCWIGVGAARALSEDVTG